jgi:hypothetical protein
LVQQEGESAGEYKKEITFGDGRVIFRFRNPTQGKVDISIETPDKKTQTLSIKNYDSAEHINLHSGGVR